VTELGNAEPTSIGWMIYLGLFPTAVAFTTWAFALSRTAAGKLGSTTYLVAPIVIVMAFVILGEVPSWLAIAGGVLCIGGVIVARSTGLRPARRRVVRIGVVHVQVSITTRQRAQTQPSQRSPI
jgi:drug/metabolite transporter (DMT)-like permease